jgi:Acyl-protein synthetase, LuxE
VSLVEESEALHDRVRHFALTGQGNFEELALSIFRFQARHSPGARRLLAARGKKLDSVDDIPAVPCDAFRLTRVAVHPPELDIVRFVTSGTTGEARGVHVMRTTRTYRELSLAFGQAALCSDGRARRSVVALAPSPAAAPHSSLGFMMAKMMQRFTGRVSADCWLIGDDGIDVAGLQRAAELALERGESLLVLSTAFALVALLERLADQRLEVPRDTVIMQTGGFKGRTRELEPETLRHAVARAFGVEPERVIGEYGMTELTSQLYEGSLPGGSLSGPPGIYLEPPWLRVVPVDPATLVPVTEGEPGIARIVDLGNVDSAVAVVTADRVLRKSGGIELLGRSPGAPPRGCSLAVEMLLSDAPLA